MSLTGDKKLSVIMVSHNTMILAIESLNHLNASMNGISGETFFVDNGSKDVSVEAVASGFPEVNIIANADNLGFAQAVNQTLLRCHGEYVLLLNPDVTIHDNTIEQLINFMETHPQAGVASPRIMYPDSRRQDFCSNFPTLTRQFFQLTGLRILFPSSLKRRFTISVGDRGEPASPAKRNEPDNRGEPFEVDWVIGACIILRRKAVENIGYLDEDFFMYGEDLDVCYRLRKNGYKVYVLPDAGVFHIGSPEDILRSGVLKEPLIHYTTYIFFKKHHGIISALILAGIQRAVSIVRLTFWCITFIVSRSMRDKARIKCRIHLSCLKGFKGWVNDTIL